MRNFDAMLSRLESIAARHGKIPALTEFGYNTIPDPNWWTGTFWKVLQKHRMAWALSWRNYNLTHYFMPFKGDLSAGDFRRFYDDPKSWFGKDVRGGKMYR